MKPFRPKRHIAYSLYWAVVLLSKPDKVLVADNLHFYLYAAQCEWMFSFFLFLEIKYPHYYTLFLFFSIFFTF